MENEPEVIRQEMEDKRTELTEKLETLEERVMKTASAISETVKNVEEGVEGTAESIKDAFQNVKDTVKESLNFSAHVERHPLGMVGGAIGVGFLTGFLLPGGRRRNRGWGGRSRETPFARYAASTTAPEPPAQTSGLMSALQHGWSRLKDTALGYLFEVVGNTVEQAVPSNLGPQLRSIVDEISTHMRGGGAHVESGTSQFASTQGTWGGEQSGVSHEPNGRTPWEPAGR